MDTYTEFLEDRARDIHPEDDIDYSRELMAVVAMFRDFDEALDTFLIKHGFSGDCSDIDAKIAYIRTKCEESGVQPPRNMKKWYTEHKRIKKETAIRICFAFSLSVEESEDFLRRICLLRGFDCHNIEEVICFYAISNGLSYSEARQLMEKAPKVSWGKIDFDKEVLYTAAILAEVRRFKSGEELIGYLAANIRQFGYNNATAYKYIREMWSEISAEGGLAAMERKRLYDGFDDTDRTIRQARRGRSGQDKPSLWEIYLQILGLAGDRISRLDTDRSLKPILKDNELLHAWAEDSFPSRVGLEKILNGEHASEQLVHKTIILLVFYRFWVKSALKNHSYQAKSGDTGRCTCEINKYLMDAGYPELYPGDPFDWVILHAVENEFPLLVFREFMRELFYIKERDVDARYASEWS
ncbi:MAG: hypothetical protein HFH87_06245 [Lachnospiraceae bacterium]|nr:hypothetical protein [Lachnospiraceae bacterium]